MSTKKHEYDVTTTYTGNRGIGTSAYAAYGREHELSSGQAPTILASADSAFRGDPARWNPEQLQVAALSQCHMLWYLNLAASAGVTVTAYEDRVHGTMVQDPSGAGQFESVILRLRVTITPDSDTAKAARLNEEVPRVCFITRSVNFPVHHEPESLIEASSGGN